MLNYILDELKKIMAIDSPSGFTRKAADYIMPVSYTHLTLPTNSLV